MDFQPMPFRFPRQAHTTAVALVITSLFAFSGCNRAAKEEKALRELRGGVANTKAAGQLARRILKLNPQDNGSWDRLVQAQFGLRDPAGVKQALEDWRRTVSKPQISTNTPAILPSSNMTQPALCRPGRKC